MPEHKQHASLLAKKILTFFFFKATCKIKWTQEVVRCLSYVTYLFFLFLFLFSYSHQIHYHYTTSGDK